MINWIKKLINMDVQPQTLQKAGEKKSEGFQDFSDRITTGIAYASGGAAIGTFIAGPVGATLGALVSGVAGLIMSGKHHDSKTHA